MHQQYFGAPRDSNSLSKSVHVAAVTSLISRRSVDMAQSLRDSCDRHFAADAPGRSSRRIRGTSARPRRPFESEEEPTMPAHLAPTAADEAAVRAIPLRMADAWNRGDADAFAAPFTENADFVAFEGTHLEGRAAIAAFHTRIFAEEVRGTRLEAEAKFVRFLGPEMAVLHATARVALAGQDRPSPSRDSMQLV